MVSNHNKNDLKEVTDKTANDEPQNDVNEEETIQNIHIATELEHTKNPADDETECSNNESVIVLENNLEPSVTDSDISHDISPNPEQALHSDCNAQLNNIPENSSPEDKAGESEIVNKSNDLTPSLSVNDNSGKDLQPEKVSSVISMDNNTSDIRTAVNDITLNDTSLNNPNKVKKAEISTESNENIKVNAHNTPQTNNRCNANSQSVSNIQMNGPNHTITQLVSQPPQIAPQPNALLEISVPTVPAILLSTLGPDGTVQSNLYRFVMNPPVFNPSPVGGISLPLPTISTPNVGSPLIVTTAPTVPLLNVENIGNNKTVPRVAEKSIATPESEYIFMCRLFVLIVIWL